MKKQVPITISTFNQNLMNKQFLYFNNNIRRKISITIYLLKYLYYINGEQYYLQF